MIDLGRPLHAYDIDKINGDTLTIRLARAGEEVEALNEKTYKLDETMLVIADAEGADDLAGIMGGQRTGVRMKPRPCSLRWRFLTRFPSRQPGAS